MFVPDPVIVAVLVAVGSMFGVLGAVVVFIRRQRAALIIALQQAGQQQVATAQQLANAIEATQRQQRHYEQQQQNLGQAVLRLRQEMQALSKRAERTAETSTADASRLLH